MNVHIIQSPDRPELATVTTRDLEIQEKKHKVSQIAWHEDPRQLAYNLIDADIHDGDVICFAGTVLRTAIWEMLAIARQRQVNLMPGRIIDHRGVSIPNGKFFSRKPQEANGHLGVPHVMLIGDTAAAKQSWKVLLDLEPSDVWSLYQPESITIQHWLSAAAALHPQWLTPDWFPVVDLSVQDLELLPVMYATNHWSDWIAFYPASGHFKLENHVQTYPVWLDNSAKPLEHWGS